MGVLSDLEQRHLIICRKVQPDSIARKHGNVILQFSNVTDLGLMD